MSRIKGLCYVSLFAPGFCFPAQKISSVQGNTRWVLKEQEEMLSRRHDTLVHLEDIFPCLQKVRLWAEGKGQSCTTVPCLLGNSHIDWRSESSQQRRDWQRPKKGCPEAEWRAVLTHILCRGTRRTVRGWESILTWSCSPQWQACVWHDMYPVPDGSVAPHNSILPALAAGTPVIHRLPRGPAERVRHCLPKPFVLAG